MKWQHNQNDSVIMDPPYNTIKWNSRRNYSKSSIIILFKIGKFQTAFGELKLTSFWHKRHLHKIRIKGTLNQEELFHKVQRIPKLEKLLSQICMENIVSTFEACLPSFMDLMKEGLLKSSEIMSVSSEELTTCYSTPSWIRVWVS